MSRLLLYTTVRLKNFKKERKGVLGIHFECIFDVLLMLQK